MRVPTIHSLGIARVATAVLVVTTSFAACSINYYYSPGVYEIPRGRIVLFESTTTVEIASIQQSDPGRNYTVVKQWGSVRKADRAHVAEAIARQLAGEITRGGRVGAPPRSSQPWRAGSARGLRGSAEPSC